MRRTFIIVAVLFICVAIAAALWSSRSRHAHASSPSIRETLQAVATNPVEFAKGRLTGGVGALLSIDPATGLLRINAVGVGSPAQQAGLCEGDIITKVDGLAVAGRPLAEIVEDIRGLSGGSVRLTVLRGGSTNLECLVARRSWSALRGQSLNPYE